MRINKNGNEKTLFENKQSLNILVKTFDFNDQWEVGVIYNSLFYYPVSSITPWLEKYISAPISCMCSIVTSVLTRKYVIE